MGGTVRVGAESRERQRVPTVMSRSSSAFTVIAAACALPTAFFTFYGVRLAYAAITFDGEGSLGHVGMYVGALLFPLLAVLFGGFTVLAWRRSGRGSAGPPPG